MNIPPHLRHLLRDKRGVCVPFINLWSSEQDSSGEIRPVIRADPLLDGRPAVFTEGRPGRGQPDFTRQHPGRQRETMIRGLCQVCRRPAGPQSCLPLGVGTTLVDTVVGMPGSWLAVTEPWLCGPCADFAGRHCPALIRRRRGDTLTLLDVRPGDTQAQLVVSRAWVEGRLESYSRRVQPYLWAKILVADEATARRELRFADTPASV